VRSSVVRKASHHSLHFLPKNVSNDSLYCREFEAERVRDAKKIGLKRKMLCCEMRRKLYEKWSSERAWHRKSAAQRRTTSGARELCKETIVRHRQ